MYSFDNFSYFVADLHNLEKSWTSKRPRIRLSFEWNGNYMYFKRTESEFSADKRM